MKPWLGILFLVLLAGCLTPRPEGLSPSAPPSGSPRNTAAPSPTAPVTPEQVTAANAHEQCARLREELDREEQELDQQDRRGGN
jgi:hypothetical protein